MRRPVWLTPVTLLACALAVNVTGQQRDQGAKTVSGRTVWDGVYTGSRLRVPIALLAGDVDRQRARQQRD